MVAEPYASMTATVVPDVKLERQTTEISFGETHFKGMQIGFWVPQEVSVAVDWNGRRLRNQHQYSDFRLFKKSAFGQA